MYGNMTREEMIQRLYKGDFATGELERQLIAKIFEQCCGGGGSSGGGDFYRVNYRMDGEDTLVCEKTAKEICDAIEDGKLIILVNESSFEEEMASGFDQVMFFPTTHFELAKDGSQYFFSMEIYGPTTNAMFTANGPDEYPTATISAPS